MAHKLGLKELTIIAYLLGITSKDIITCKLICKSWNLYLIQIVPNNKIEDDEKEEEKSYIPRTKQSSKQPLTSKLTIKTYII